VVGGWIKKIYYKMIRELKKEDYYKSYLDLINYFTKYPRKYSYEEFVNIFNNINNSIILVIEKDDKIIGTAKLLIEQKFHNNFAKMGHIEDVVILEEYRGSGYGSLLMEKLIELGKEKNCYKIVLNCNKENIDYYKKLGFMEKGLEMSLYF